ncbi:hypothetical protein [Aestuariivirga sp.]|uniref:hypothetical protein n=1 Tax=Aestuariivirga sp. TaxID=2650926 RepID=UPI0025BFC8CB|nr:hypothetical protein [Aestuariivirga sp.]MCA3554724.1 hypothetical protein [Aestuariivirga sp.]
MLAAAGAALGQEQQDWTSSFTRIKGGAIYEFRIGVDGSAVDEDYELTHLVCTDGSKSLRLMLPYGPGDDYQGSASTLRRTANGWRVVFTANGRKFPKALELKSVNDKAAHRAQQFVVRLDHGDPLWKAMTGGDPLAARIMMNEGGLPVMIDPDPKLDKMLKSCGLGG